MLAGNSHYVRALINAKAPIADNVGAFYLNLCGYRRMNYKDDTRPIFKLGRSGLHLEADLTPWLRFCVGTAVLLLAAAPVLWVVRWW
ncbi:protein of unknown function [Thauera humireducens]|nr:protein of unknown function [Thauera humireducens]